MVPLSDARVLHENICLAVMCHPDPLASDTHPDFLGIRYVAGNDGDYPSPSIRRLCRVNSRAKDGTTRMTAAMATTTSATKVAWVAPALVSVTPVPGSSTGYWATPQPQMTAATPSAAMSRGPLGRPAGIRAS